MHIDFKITTWERVKIPKEKEAEVLKLLKEGKVTSSSDLYDQSESEGYINYDCEQLVDTSESLTPEENGGSSTTEVWEHVSERNQPMKCTWQNGEGI